jgi:hypothetical protein
LSLFRRSEREGLSGEVTGNISPARPPFRCISFQLDDCNHLQDRTPQVCFHVEPGWFLVNTSSVLALPSKQIPTLRIICSCFQLFLLSYRHRELFAVSWKQQGLSLVRQVLCHLSHTLSPFCFSHFSGKISHFLPGLAWTLIFLLILPAQLG